MSYSSETYENVWAADDVIMRVAKSSDLRSVVINIVRLNGEREVDITVNFDQTTVLDEWEIPGTPYLTRKPVWWAGRDDGEGGLPWPG